MMKMLPIFVISAIILFLSTTQIRSQVNRDFSVIVTAKVENTSKPKIILSWPDNKFATGYDIRRKSKIAISWTPDPIATLDSGVTTWTDTNVKVGTIYEYQVRSISQTTNTISSYTGLFKWAATGYVASGIEVPAPETFPKVLILCDQKTYDGLSSQLSRLEDDLLQEGWYVVTKVAPRAEKFDSGAVKAVKQMIKDEYLKDSKSLKTVFLLGRIPVPYSGRITPDGHVVGSGNHTGAWAADVYYAEMNEIWTDNIINDTTGARAETRNVPYDGKFDNSYITASEVEIGRVDLYNMPAFKMNELQLLKQYLDRDHNYRTGNLNINARGILEDNFAPAGFTYYEAPASSTWKNFGTLVGAENVTPGRLLDKISNESYMFVYGCAGSGYTNCGNIISTDTLSKKGINTIFMMLFGSFFGDWDNSNNLLRAPLAATPGSLTNAWCARPHWYLHHMGLGETIGYAAKLSQSNYNTYEPFYWYEFMGNSFAYPSGYAFRFSQHPNQMVHVALMGDPTLRLYHPDVPPAKNISIVQPPGKSIEIKWDRSDDVNATYNIFRATERSGPYTKINDTPLTTTFFTDSNLYEGSLYYIVKANSIKTTLSGTFYNTSRSLPVSVLATGVNDLKISDEIICSPNPATTELNITLSLAQTVNTDLSVFDVSGNLMSRLYSGALSQGTHQISWGLTNIQNERVAPGVYFVKFVRGNELLVQKIVVMP